LTQDLPKSEESPAPDPAFFWIAVGMLAMLVLCGAVTAALMASQADQINRQGGMGWILVGGIFVAAATLVFSDVQAISTPAAINENIDLAMLHPNARGTTSDTKDCEEWPGKSTGIVEKVLDAFKSYQPSTIPVRVNPIK
jgi:hypothetical protein